MIRMSSAAARALTALKSDNEMKLRVPSHGLIRIIGWIDGEVDILFDVVRLGQDAVRGDHCGDGECWRLSPGRPEGKMRGGLRAKIQPSSEENKVSGLL